MSGLNLRAISGPEAFDGSNPLTANYYQTADFAGAGQALTELALSNCAGTLSVVKQIVPEDNTGEDITGATPAGEGWEFTATTTTPGIGGLPDTQETTADRTGAVSFSPTYPAGTDSADIAVTEDQRPGYDLVTQGGLNAVCTDLDTGEPVQVTNTGTNTNPGFGVDVPRLSAISCTMYNRPQQDEEAEITVEKEWFIDGKTYSHDDRPDGYEADLTLTGPGTNGPTSQEWGEDRDGYTLGDTTTIAETVTVPNTCTVDSSRIVSANGSTADEPLPYEAQLTETENTFTVRNTVSCEDEDESRLTLVKRVINQHGGTAEPGDWTLTANGPETLSGTSGSEGVTDVTVPPGSYTLGETGGPEGYRPAGWECEDSEGEEIPVADDQVTLAAGDSVTCTLTNKDHGTSPSPSPHPTPQMTTATATETTDTATTITDTVELATAVSGGGVCQTGADSTGPLGLPRDSKEKTQVRRDLCSRRPRT
ncbi:hypothetical protein [Streptomyces sp. NPDC058240]|uniref:hypothetical protein n=1 Tax=Streptomyces sp. NPDC058240 TaxID=3346396 RepID=UPI0036EA66BC